MDILIAFLDFVDKYPWLPFVIVIGAKFFNVEERCVSYVAATRARNLLVWTKMPGKKKYKDTSVSSWER